jgi:hypothetical protein
LPEALVDPHIHPEEHGYSPDSSKSEEGVNYLRRLKGELAKRAPVEAGGKVGGNAPEATSTFPPERRRTTRLRCSGSVEFQVMDSEVRMWGTLTDISTHGCYVEMSNTFPVDTQVYLVLKSCGYRVQAPGTVRASYPALGMGICFSEIDPVQQQQLQQLLAMLAGEVEASSSAPARENAMKSALGVADPKTLLDEITEFFRKNPLLSRDEFHQIAKRARRS